MDSLTSLTQLLFTLVASGMAGAFGLCAIQLTDLLSEYWNILAMLVTRVRPKKKVRLFSCTEELLLFLTETKPWLSSLLTCPFCLGWWLTIIPVLLCITLFGLPLLWHIVLWPASTLLAVTIRRRIGTE